MDESQLDSIAKVAASLNNLEDYLVATANRAPRTINPVLITEAIEAMRGALDVLGVVVVDDDEEDTPMFDERERVSFVISHLSDKGMLATREEINAVLDADAEYLTAHNVFLLQMDSE